MTDHEALLRAIAENPDDDTPRLVFADWLEEHADSQPDPEDWRDRSGLIRGQVELARIQASVEFPSRDRTQYLAGLAKEARRLSGEIKAILSRHTGDKATGRRWDRCPCPDHEVREGSRCNICGDSGDLLLRREWHQERHYRLNQPRPLTWDRGFAVVGARLDELAVETCLNPEDSSCDGTGHIWRPSRWLLALPLEFGIAVEWVEPFEWTREDGGSDWLFTVRTDNQIPAPLDIPRWLFNLLEGGRKNADNWTIRFPSPDAALAALNLAVAQWRLRQLDLTKKEV